MGGSLLPLAALSACHALANSTCCPSHPARPLTPAACHPPAQVKGTFVNGFEFVECKVVDWSGLDLNQCWNAPPTEPCTAACKENIDKLPQACVSRVAAARRPCCRHDASHVAPLACPCAAAAAGPAWALLSVLTPSRLPPPALLSTPPPHSHSWTAS